MTNIHALQTSEKIGQLKLAAYCHYSTNADLTAMASKDILSETNSYFKSLDKTDYLKSLKETDRKQLLEIKKLYGGMSANALMKHTYINFPYWATKSEKAESILTKTELEKVKSSIPANNNTVLFQLGTKVYHWKNI